MAMKKLVYLFLMLCLMAGCTHTSHHPRLVAVDSLLASQPDSAIYLLNHFDSTNASQSDRLYYQLLCYKAADKQDELHATTEEAEQFIDCFESAGDAHLLPMAYYYSGRICVENSNAPQALAYFHQAEELLSDDQDKVLLSKVYSQMGYLFVQRRMYDKARQYFEKSYETDKDICDTIGMIYNLRDIGVSYKWADKEKESLPYFYQSLHLAKDIQNEFMCVSVTLQLSGAYLEINEVDSAIKYGIPLLKTIERTDSSAVLCQVAEIYDKSCQTDSAELYSLMLLKCGRIDARCKAHQILTKVYLQKKQYANALYNYQQYLELKYNTEKLNSTEEIAQANAAYNYQTKEVENYELRIKNNEQEIIVLLLIGSAVALVLLLSIIFNRYRNGIAKLEELKRINNEQYRRSSEYINKSRQRIAELKVQLQNADSLNENLCVQLAREKEKLESSVEIAILKERESKRALRVIKDSEVYCRMIQLTSNGKPQCITIADWLELEKVVNQEFNGFTIHLRELCRMSDLEMHVCLLLKTETDLHIIAEMLMKALSTISSIRIRLYMKAFGKKGQAKDWDAVITTL